MNAKLDQLEEDARTLARGLPDERGSTPSRSTPRPASSVVQARVVIYTPLGAQPAASRATRTRPRRATSSATRSRCARPRRGTLQRGTVERDGRRFAEVALPADQTGSVILLSDSLADPLSSLDLVERQLLVAGLIGLAVRGRGRLRARLDARPPDRAGSSAPRSGSPAGRLDEPVVDTGHDELGQLADAFERMRVSGWRTSTAPAASSSPTRRTSCGRRSSRSAASSS